MAIFVRSSIGDEWRFAVSFLLFSVFRIRSWSSFLFFKFVCVCGFFFSFILKKNNTPMNFLLIGRLEEMLLYCVNESDCKME
jgi:hypothetical protein